MNESVTCPRCARTSYNPHDVREGYCGACHDWTVRGSLWKPRVARGVGCIVCGHDVADHDDDRCCECGLDCGQTENPPG